MKLVGFNFTKISSEKDESGKKPNDLNLKTNISFSEIKEVSTEVMKTKDQLIKVVFRYTINYNPNYATLDFAGNLVLSLDSKQAKDVLKQWNENKMPEDFRASVSNVILKKCNVKALELEDEINLPFHIPFPSVKKSQNQKNQK